MCLTRYECLEGSREGEKGKIGRRAGGEIGGNVSGKPSQGRCYSLSLQTRPTPHSHKTWPKNTDLPTELKIPEIILIIQKLRSSSSFRGLWPNPKCFLFFFFFSQKKKSVHFDLLVARPCFVSKEIQGQRKEI